jgi:hypothetical protein
MTGAPVGLPSGNLTEMMRRNVMCLEVVVLTGTLGLGNVNAVTRYQ